MYCFVALLCMLVLIGQSSCTLYRHGHVPHTKARIDWPTHHKRVHHHQDKYGYWHFKRWRNAARVIPHYQAVEVSYIFVAYPQPGQYKSTRHELVSPWRTHISVGDSTRKLPQAGQPTLLLKKQ